MTARPSPSFLALLVAFGCVALPLLQLVPVDFERTAAPLAFALPLLFGWRVWLGEAARWLARPRTRVVILGALGFLLLITWHAAQPAPALVQTAHDFVLVLLALLVAGLIRSDPKTSRRLLHGVIASGLLGTFTLVWPWLTHPDPHHAPTEILHWLYPNIRHIGLHLLPAAALAPVLLVAARKPMVRALWWMLGIVLATALVWSGGRSPLFGIIAAAIAAGCCLPRIDRRRLALAYVAVFITGLFASTQFWTTAPQFGWWRMWRSSANAITDGDINDLSSSRVDLWRASAGFISESPWLGYGPDGYRFLTPKMVAQQPHNVLVQWLLAGGVPGCLLGLAGVAWLLRRPKSSHAEPDVGVTGARAILAALTAGSLLDGFLYHVLCTTIFAIAAGMMLAYQTSNQPAEAKTPAWTRLPAPALAVVAAALLALHAWLFARLISTVVPAPDSIPARVLHVFPSTTFGLDRWLDTWAESDPATALTWSRWAVRHSAYAWLFHRWSALTLARLGRLDDAQAELDAFNRIRPDAFRETLRRDEP